MDFLLAMPPLLRALAVYGMIGFGFALIFVIGIVNLLDAHARGGTFGFRLMILPASIILWPLLLLVSVVRAGIYVFRDIKTKRKARSASIVGWIDKTKKASAQLKNAAIKKAKQ